MSHLASLQRLFSPLTQDKLLDQSYLVGGCVRDLLLGIQPQDIDLLIPSDPERLARLIVDKIGGRVIPWGKTRGIVRVVFSKAHPAYDRSVTGPGLSQIDIATLGRDSLIQNLNQRDFTINAMAMALKALPSPGMADHLIDPYQGERDLKLKIVRALSPNAFSDDPLRLLRAFRFSTLMGLHIEGNTLIWIRDHAGLLPQSASERIRDEFFCILKQQISWPTIQQMQAVGLLEILFSWVRSDPEAPESPMQDFRHLEQAFQDPSSGVPSYDRALEEFLGERLEPGISRMGMMKWCALAGAGTLGAAAYPGSSLAPRPKSWCLSRKSQEFVSSLMKGLQSLDRKHFDRELFRDPNGRLLWIYRFYKNIGANGLAALRYWQIVNQPLKKEEEALYQEMIRFHGDQRPPFRPPLITGEDLIRRFGLTPGPAFRMLLDAVEEKRITESWDTKEQALDYLGTQITSDSEGVRTLPFDNPPP